LASAESQLYENVGYSTCQIASWIPAATSLAEYWDGGALTSASPFNNRADLSDLRIGQRIGPASRDWRAVVGERPDDERAAGLQKVVDVDAPYWISPLGIVSTISPAAPPIVVGDEMLTVKYPWPSVALALGQRRWTGRTQARGRFRSRNAISLFKALGALFCNLQLATTLASLAERG
jgi:hypothetical protein